MCRMEKVNLGYSEKNILITGKQEYRDILTAKTQKFLFAARWRAYFHLHPSSRPQEMETFGFKSNKKAPAVQELKEFECRMIEMVQNIKFRVS